MNSLPPYTYIPGKTPHPISDPAGHMYGTSDAIEDDHKSMFDRAVELFNNGYYWEAHEAWEQVWMAHNKKGPQADFIKALIKLSACGVKCLEGNRTGAERHLRRSGELLGLSHAAVDSIDTFGVSIAHLLQQVSNLETKLPIQDSEVDPGPVQPLLGIIPMSDG
ncbi:DUF309 domain-containing protein [Thalassoglobus sp. JC818]|uniref:DUF309 domain-containing protein n=1 Tax=Thalassoglobus sp. JC818 TaxID=3232136 RepID=UPI00345B18D7